jgi:hypothetical protein
MKHTKLMAITTLFLLGISGAAAQSLGDAARAARKNKTEQVPANRHFDNDNLPTNDTLSVVGPAPAEARADQAAKAQPADAAAANAATTAERQKTIDDWSKKLDEQREKVNALNHELDMDQREYKLKQAALYGDAGTRMRNEGAYETDEREHRSEIESKQKELDDARSKLDEMQEQARKGGVAQKDADASNNSNKDSSQNKTNDTDKK